MARPDVSDLAMIAVYPTADEARSLSGRAQGWEKMHVTIVFLGEVDEIDMGAAARAVGSVSGSTAPLSGTVGGVGLFMAGDDGYPQIALPDVVGLARLRTDMVNALAEENIVSSSEHDWVPHLTLDYVEEPALAEISVIGKALTFDQISLVVADERKDFPFDPGGSADDHSDGRNRMSVYRTRAEQRRLAMAGMR